MFPRPRFVAVSTRPRDDLTRPQPLSEHVELMPFPDQPPDPDAPAQTFVLEQHSLGVFAQLNLVLQVGKYCEEAGIRPYFHVINANLLDPQHGPNWIDYFFEQHTITHVDIGAVQQQLTASRVVHIANRYDVNFLARGHRLTEFQNEFGDVREASRLFHRHLRFRQSLVDAADSFVAESLGDSPFLGVHYRATDKAGTEAHPVEFLGMARQIETYRGGCPIFVATDSPEFLEFCCTRFGEDVVSFSAPDGASHLDQQDRNYDKGRVAIIDCLILSRSRTLIKTPSALSAWSKVLNDSLCLVLVGEPMDAAVGRDFARRPRLLARESPLRPPDRRGRGEQGPLLCRAGRFC